MDDPRPPKPRHTGKPKRRRSASTSRTDRKTGDVTWKPRRQRACLPQCYDDMSQMGRIKTAEQRHQIAFRSTAFQRMHNVNNHGSIVTHALAAAVYPKACRQGRTFHVSRCERRAQGTPLWRGSLPTLSDADTTEARKPTKEIRNRIAAFPTP